MDTAIQNQEANWKTVVYLGCGDPVCVHFNSFVFPYCNELFLDKHKSQVLFLVNHVGTFVPR